jgi:hypothetical protein
MIRLIERIHRGETRSDKDPRSQTPNKDGLDQMKTIKICGVAAYRLTLVHSKSVNI